MTEISLETIIKLVEGNTKLIQKLTEVNDKLIQRIESLEKDLDEKASIDSPESHYHDEYASIDHVERSESSFNSQLYQIKNDLSNLEYRCSDVERKAERAENRADEARRMARGGW